jgi:formate hydrogenlyase subunit 6/NADH:ubiquinone oxidoreductase subunit I
MGRNKSYWGNIMSSARSLWSGLRITFRHILKARSSQKPIFIADKTYFDNPEGIATIQYPHVSLPVPDTGRYKLHNEIDDCIVCDKCVKICPVNCITIEPIRATEEIGRTSDGTPKRIYAAKFDIDMGKCCFCGLCTTVCPTECLTMTKTYDFSVFDIRQHNFEFADMTPQQIEEKKKLFEEHQKNKTAATTSTPASAAPSTSSAGESPKPARPVFKPKIKPPGT